MTMTDPTPEVEEFLEHYGVKGMKWGVRRSAAELARIRGQRRQATKDVRKLKKINRKGGKGSRAKYEAKKSEIEEKKSKDLAYKKKANIVEKRTREEDRQVRVAKGLAAAYGAAYVTEYMARSIGYNRQQRAFENEQRDFWRQQRSNSSSNSGSRSRTSSSPKTPQDIINANRKVKIDAINKTFREGFIDEAQRDSFVKKMEARYDRKLREGDTS